MYISFFNNFKERLVNGKLKDSFWVDCYPVTDAFFTNLNTDEHKVENFRTVKDLVAKGWNGLCFSYEQKSVYAEYCCEYLTEPYTMYTNKQIGNANYRVIASQRYKFKGARMNYRYVEDPAGKTVLGAGTPIATGLVRYDYTTRSWLVHFFNHLDLPQPPNFHFATGVENDGTVIYMGYVPSKQQMVDDLAIRGRCDGILPIYGRGFRGLVFADKAGELIEYIDFEDPADFEGGCFVYRFPEVTEITDPSGLSAKWATFARLV